MQTLFTLVPLIVFLPVLGLLANIIFGGRLGEKAIGTVASAAAGLAFVVSLLLGYGPVADRRRRAGCPLRRMDPYWHAEHSLELSAWTPSR